MLVIPEGSSPITSIIGIDPGSIHLGIGIIEVDVRDFSIVSCEAFAFNGEQLGRDSWESYLHGDRFGRIHALRKNLLRLFRLRDPILEIASEAAFINPRRPAAYGALMEVICAIRQAVMAFDRWMPLYMVEASVAKAAVGAKGNSGDKLAVRNGLMKIPEIVDNYKGSIPLDKLTEHASDGLAIAYARYKTRKAETLRLQNFVLQHP